MSRRPRAWMIPVSSLVRGENRLEYSLALDERLIQGIMFTFFRISRLSDGSESVEKLSQRINFLG